MAIRLFPVTASLLLSEAVNLGSKEPAKERAHARVLKYCVSRLLPAPDLSGVRSKRIFYAHIAYFLLTFTLNVRIIESSKDGRTKQ